MIPKVVSWRVRFLRDGKTVAEVNVATVSRLFARWLALEQFPQGFAIGTQVKVSRSRRPACPAGTPACSPDSMR